MDHLPVIQFDYASLSSVNEKGEQVRMRTILDTSTGYGTACVIDVDPEPAIKAMVDAIIKCLSDDRAVEQILPEETIPESHAILGALEGWHNLLQGQIRALRLDVEDRFGSIVGVTHQ